MQLKKKKLYYIIKLGTPPAGVLCLMYLKDPENTRSTHGNVTINATDFITISFFCYLHKRHY